LLIPVNRFDRISKLTSATRLDLDESYCAVALDHEINIPMAAPVTTLHDAPTVSPEPSLRDPFAQLPEFLSGR
jgi:hypothetical protein